MHKQTYLTKTTLISSLGAALAIALLAPSTASAAPDPLALMKKADKRHRIEIAETWAVKMVLQKQGEKPRERTYQMVRLQDDKNGDKTRINFTKPANIRGTALLTLEARKNGKRIGDDDQWLYLPAFKRTRRVGAAELGDRFAASDIFYEDIKRRQVEDYSYKMLRSEKLGGKDCYVIQAKPSAPSVKKNSPYGRTEIWLRKDILAIVKMRHFDKRKRPLKEITFEKLKPLKGKVYRAQKIVLIDVQRKHRTVLLAGKRKLVSDLPKDTFTRNSLRLLE